MEHSIKVLLRSNGGFSERAIKLDPLKQWKSQEQKPNAWKLSFEESLNWYSSIIYKIVESLTVLKSARLRWNKAFSLRGPAGTQLSLMLLFFLTAIY